MKDAWRRPAKPVANSPRDGMSAHRLSSWSMPQGARRRQGTRRVPCRHDVSIGYPACDCGGTPGALERQSRMRSRRLVEHYQPLLPYAQQAAELHRAVPCSYLHDAAAGCLVEDCERIVAPSRRFYRQ